MARNASGTHSNPLANVVTGNVIEAAWANTTISDLSVEITDSLSRSGKGNMSAALKVTAGTVGAPGLSFVDEASSGLYRAGAADIRVALSGAEFARITSAGLRLADTGLVLGTAGQGVSFAANTGTAATGAATTNEVLTHFEEGTWTPNLWDNTNSSAEGQTYSTQSGRFSRFGRTVFFEFRLGISSVGTLTTNQQAKIGPLPYQPSTSSAGAVSFSYLSSISISTDTVVGEANNSGSAIFLYRFTGSTLNNMVISDLATGSLYGSGWFTV